tara:strand:- start:13930 stop:14112 length:183 start_codon:yes stop_codon:yes gene_type:complete
VIDKSSPITKFVKQVAKRIFQALAETFGSSSERSSEDNDDQPLNPNSQQVILSKAALKGQ